MLVVIGSHHARTSELTFHSDYRETITDQVGIQLLRFTKILHFLSYKSYKITFLHELPLKLERLRRCRMVSRCALYLEWVRGWKAYRWQGYIQLASSACHTSAWPVITVVGDVTWRQTWPPPLTSALCSMLHCFAVPRGATWVRYKQTSQRAY